MIPKAAHNPDEIILKDLQLFHLEKMSNDYLWLGVYGKDGSMYHLHIHAKDNNLKWYWYDCNDDWLETFKEKHD